MGNGFSEEQEALIEKIAWKVSEKIEIRLEKHIATSVATHQSDCPHGKKVGRVFLIGIGVAIGAVVVGGVTGWGLAVRLAGLAT